MRNPYAKSLRAKPQQVIGDKRGKLRERIAEHFSASLEALYDVDPEIPEDMQALLSRLK